MPIASEILKKKGGGASRFTALVTEMALARSVLYGLIRQRHGKIYFCVDNVAVLN